MMWTLRWSVCMPVGLSVCHTLSPGFLTQVAVTTQYVNSLRRRRAAPTLVKNTCIGVGLHAVTIGRTASAANAGV